MSDQKYIVRVSIKEPCDEWYVSVPGNRYKFTDRERAGQFTYQEALGVASEVFSREQAIFDGSPLIFSLEFIEVDNKSL